MTRQHPLGIAGWPIGKFAQAFAFSTNDEVNNMQFYNYVLINQARRP